jgi:probable rRNA maturation factor
VSGDLHVEAQVGEGVEPPLPLERVEAAVRFVLRERGVERAELSVTLLGDPQIEQMNREFLQHEGPTDVISFPLEAPGGVVVGDVYLGAAQALRQAEQLGVPAAEEVLRLAVHGTLHVLGFDHPHGEDGREESEMYRLQEELLGRFLAGGAAA